MNGWKPKDAEAYMCLSSRAGAMAKQLEDEENPCKFAASIYRLSDAVGAVQCYELGQLCSVLCGAMWSIPWIDTPKLCCVVCLDILKCGEAAEKAPA